jgi:regulator of protease activity HflC (stomatin/prohibitin superfamily)
MMQLLETTLRQEVGKLDSDTLIVSRDTIGSNIQRYLEQASEAWGAKILRVEIQELRFSDEVQQKLTKAREAELSRRARVVTAQQDRDTEILLAEGKKRAAVLVAEGEFEAAKLRAEADFLLASRRLEGEAAGTRALAEALRNNPEVMVAIKALEAQKSVAESLGRSTSSLIVPGEVAGLLGALGAVKNALTFMNHAAATADGAGPALRRGDGSARVPIIETKPGGGQPRATA